MTEQETADAPEQVAEQTDIQAWTAEQAIEEWRTLIEKRHAAEATYQEQIAEFKETFESETQPIDAKLNDLEAWFLDHAEAAGVESFAGDGGTVSVSSRENPKISDADSFFAWAESTNNSGLLQKRISVTEFRSFQKEHPDQIPPGVTIETTRSAKFKAAK